MRERIVDRALGRVRTGGVAPLGVIESPRKGKLGVACSGGGVRSAAFNLGALQVLKERNELPRAKYLTAVSGGSYISAALSIVETQTADGGSFAAAAPYAAGSPEERWLRDHSSYIAPGISGKLRLLLRLLVGMATNFLAIGVFLFVIARPLGWVYQRYLLRNLIWAPNPVRIFAPWIWLSVATPAAAAALLGWWEAVFRPRREAVRRFLVTWAFRLFVLAVLAFVGVLLLPYSILLLRHGFDDLPKLVRDLMPQAKQGAAVTSTPGVPGVSLAMLGSLALAALRALWAKQRSRVAMLVAAVIGPVLVFFTFVWFLNGGVNWTSHSELRLWGALLAGFLAFYLVSDLTNWSGHPFYKRVLSSAYAVERTDADTVQEVPYDRLLRLSSTQPPHAPELIVCAAANITTAGVTPAGRNATSFSFSAREVGGPIIGAVPTRDFEEVLGPRSRDMTLPAAIAMSGAAVSPSMGKLTIRSLTFLFALTGIRLGVWLPNPRWADRWARRRSGGLRRLDRPRLIYLLKELLGLDSVEDKYLYVTDGGHFENLGLVELLRRGCTEVYVFDASGEKDDTFFTLGQAIAIAREDLKVAVEIDPGELCPKEGEDGCGHAGLCGTDHAVGAIRYPGDSGDDGVLVYAKAAVTAESPYETKAYRQRDPQFPHHPTFDQLFNDEKFEAYWALGRFTAGRAVGAMQKARNGPGAGAQPASAASPAATAPAAPVAPGSRPALPSAARPPSGAGLFRRMSRRSGERRPRG